MSWQKTGAIATWLRLQIIVTETAKESGAEGTIRVKDSESLHFHPVLHNAFGTNELARAAAACNGTYTSVASSSHCAGIEGVDRVDLNPSGRESTPALQKTFTVTISSAITNVCIFLCAAMYLCTG
eukprot:SAG31_NODE_4106_length_3577_cov_3.156699_5_plen_126_part_00